MARKRRRSQVDQEPVQECDVLPPHLLLYAPVDLETGGKFLRELEGFLASHRDGKVVLGTFRLPEDTASVMMN